MFDGQGKGLGGDNAASGLAVVTGNEGNNARTQHGTDLGLGFGYDTPGQ